MLDRLARHLPALPYPHFMAFAPLDCWARMLVQNGAITRIAPRYWLRVAGALCTSTLGTLLTLPERALLAVPQRRALRSAGHQGPPIVVVLGYYRSGTTHLHYLLSCDPGMVTPRWHQALAPSGFAVSWLCLRYFLVPFLSSKRPQDDVAFGPEYPAEDDFAVCNTNASCSLPGRMALPGEWAHYRRLHGFEQAGAGEVDRFRAAQHAFTWRLSLLNPRKTLLLKTPSHTARVRLLSELYGDRVRFVHISRPPTAVLASNIAMHERFASFLLQDHPGDAEIARRVIDEYDASERAFLEQSARLPPDRLARLRYQDLIADPIGQVERVYTQLGMTLSPAAREKMTHYLRSVSAYRTASQRASASPKREEPSPQPLPDALRWLIPAFGHDQATVPERSIPAAPNADPSVGSVAESPVASAILAALWCIAGWLLIAYFGGSRFDWLVWPVGVTIGLAALKTAGKGTPRLGILCAVLTALTMLIVAFPATWITDYKDARPVPWDHVWLSTRRGVLATNNWFWMILGVLSAHRFGSREHLRPPGL